MTPLSPAPFWHSVGEHELPGSLGWLSPDEWDRAATMRFAKRRSDYLLGRLAGKSAVAQALGLSAAPSSLRRIEVRNRASGPERGAPELFVDGTASALEISITDRAGWAVCMLRAGGLRLGCDLELVEERSDAFVADYLTAQEQAFVASAPAGPARWLRANAIWSAKESVLKVLRTGLRRDTRSVEVHFPNEARGDGWKALHATTREGRVFSGWWRRFGAFLLTFASESPTAAPRAFVSPPALAAATPSHRWMDAPLGAERAHG